MCPRVSVVMPIYNAMPYLGQAIDSILRQTYTDFQIMAIDDGSDDESWSVVRERAERDHRVEPIQIEHSGIVAALNRGLEAARGEFIARMDADDISRPNRLAQQVAFLDRHPDVVAVGTDLLRIDDRGGAIGKMGVAVDHEAIESVMLRGQAGAMTHATTMWRRAVLDACGGYYQQWAQHAEDLELFLRMAEQGRLANLDCVLYEVRKHTSSVTHLESERHLYRLKQRIVNQARARRGLELISKLDGVADREINTLDHRLLWAWRALGAEHYGTARRHAWAVARGRPMSWRAWVILVGMMLPRRVLRKLRDQRRRKRSRTLKAAGASCG